LKKQKTPSELKELTPKKWKLAKLSSEETKIQDVPKQIMSPSSFSVAKVSEILKVMTEPFPFALLSPLRLDLTSLLQSKEITSATKGKTGGKRSGVVLFAFVLLFYILSYRVPQYLPLSFFRMMIPKASGPKVCLKH
jgi:hypothetical protein